MIKDVVYIIDTDVCKDNVLCHIRRTGRRCAVFVECTAYSCDELLFGC